MNPYLYSSIEPLISFIEQSFMPGDSARQITMLIEKYVPEILVSPIPVRPGRSPLPS